MAVWFTADTHFGHAGAIGHWGRPYISVDAMDAALIENWNRTVAPGDTVWHLGDFALRHDVPRMEAILKALHGSKHLIAGNNDGPPTRGLKGWASVGDYAELAVEDGTRLVLGHYAFRTWNRMYKGAWNLHGHSHGALKGMTRQVDVGVDVWSFRPVDFATIRAKHGRRRTADGTEETLPDDSPAPDHPPAMPGAGE